MSINPLPLALIVVTTVWGAVFGHVLLGFAIGITIVLVANALVAASER